MFSTMDHYKFNEKYKILKIILGAIQFVFKYNLISICSKSIKLPQKNKLALNMHSKLSILIKRHLIKLEWRTLP